MATIRRSTFLKGMLAVSGAALSTGIASQALAGPGDGLFERAGWLWTPIPPDPVLDDNSATWAGYLSDPDADRVLSTYEFGAPIYYTHDTDGKRRPGSWQTIEVTGDWGDPFADYNPIWMPDDAAPSPQSDSAMTIVDPERELTFEFWQARLTNNGTWATTHGGVLYLHGRANQNQGGSETGQHGAVGTGVSRLAGLVTRDDIAAGAIEHALVLSTDIAAPEIVRYPATKTDGVNNAGLPTPIPEAARIQLHPNADLSGIEHEYELLIARALQTYGAYVIDNGGARAGIVAEGHDPEGPRTGTGWPGTDTPVPGNPVHRGSTFWKAGMTGTGAGYQSLDAIPWNQIRVLASWNGR